MQPFWKTDVPTMIYRCVGVMGRGRLSFSGISLSMSLNSLSFLANKASSTRSVKTLKSIRISTSSHRPSLVNPLILDEFIGDEFLQGKFLSDN